MSVTPMFTLVRQVPATAEISSLSLHDALPISGASATSPCPSSTPAGRCPRATRLGSRPSEPRASPSTTSTGPTTKGPGTRSEEHTSELQSRRDLVCRPLLEKKNFVDQTFSHHQ